MHAAPGGENAGDPAPFRLGGGGKIPEHAVHGVLIEDADIAVGQDVALERFEF